jgi:hypothetical protein
MTTPSAGAQPTPGAATGDKAAADAAAAAAGSQGGDQAAAAAKAAADKAAADKAAADKAAADAAGQKVKGAEALFEGVLDPAAAKAAADKAAADKAAADKAAADKAAADAAAAATQTWLLADGVPGKEAPPEWFLADKYKTVAEQAKAYVEAQKKLGGFTGAPKDGNYEIKLPSTVVGEIDPEHPMTQRLVEFARTKNMSQEAFSEAIGIFAEYEASLIPTLEDIHAEIGDNAVSRINSLGNWAKANLMPEELATFVEATSGSNAAAVVKAVEAIVAKTRQPSIGRPGTDAASSGPGTLAEINAMQARVNPKTGKRFYEEDAGYRANVENARMAYFKAQQPANKVI